MQEMLYNCIFVVQKATKTGITTTKASYLGCLWEVFSSSHFDIVYNIHKKIVQVHDAVRAIIIFWKSEWEAVMSLKAAGLLLKDFQNLSERLSLTATDYVWKGMFSFHTGELEGYCSTYNNTQSWIP